MIIASIILMVLGVAVFAAGFAFPKKGAATPVSFEKPAEKEEEIIFTPVKTTPIVDNGNKNQGKNKNKKEAAPTEAVNAIEAAKRKAKEAVNQDYSFDLHLTDSSNQTVEELERDLLSGLEIADGEGEVADTEAAQPKTNQNKSNRSNKKGGKKKNTPVNDRYDDLLFEDTPAESADTANSGNNGNSGNNAGNKSGNGNANNGGNKQGNNNSKNKKGKKK